MIIPLLKGDECDSTMADNYLQWGLDSQVGSVVGQSAKVPGSIPGGAKVLGTVGIGKYLPVSVSSK